MVGLLLWKEGGRELRPVRLKEISVLHTRFLCARMSRSRRTPEGMLHRRVKSAGQRLLRQGVERVVLPVDVSVSALPEGLRPVSTVPLRRALAAEWAGELLRLRDLRPGCARLLVTAGGLSPQVVRAVTELSLRHRYLLLAVPYGGEELARRLRREYGVSVLLDPSPAQQAEADLHIAFDPADHQGGGFLPLYDETVPLPLLLPPEVEARLPEGAERGQLVSVLWEQGALRPGQVSIRMKSAEKTGVLS